MFFPEFPVTLVIQRRSPDSLNQTNQRWDVINLWIFQGWAIKQAARWLPQWLNRCAECCSCTESERCMTENKVNTRTEPTRICWHHVCPPTSLKILLNSLNFFYIPDKRVYHGGSDGAKHHIRHSHILLSWKQSQEKRESMSACGTSRKWYTWCRNVAGRGRV